MSSSSRGQIDYHWVAEPRAADLVRARLEAFAKELPWLHRLGQRMRAETGTRLCDWVDHLRLPESSDIEHMLVQAGFSRQREGSEDHWCHRGGIFPDILVDASAERSSLALKVESVVDFLHAHQIDAEIIGAAGSPLRTARITESVAYELWVVERHGCRLFAPVDVSATQITASMRHAEAFVLRRRHFADPAEGFRHAARLIDAASRDLGIDWACDRFFAAERRYWQSRNRAARVQRRRQDALGLGWANHDHHTYRCSREHFKPLVELLQQLGMKCRERFYGGAEAGWGAQVLEQPATGIVVFADVDLTPTEVIGDFAHEGLEPRSELGTVGLWCALHGEAIFQAGMHHLECQFDFDAARKQLAVEGIETMPPFTDLPELKQAFTRGETWMIDPQRIQAAVDAGAISRDQAQRFTREGSLGSHSEILQRDDGYKGFNQSGISDIIRQTDPR